MVRVGVLAVTTFLGLFMGCTLVTSLDGLSGHAGTGASEADSDATTPPGADASDASDGGAGGWCASNAPDTSFCTAFDRGDLGDFERTVTNNGTLVVDDQTPSSARFSMLAHAEARTTGSSAFYASAETPPGVRELTVELAVRLEEASRGDTVLQILKLATRNGPREWETGFAIEATTRRLFFYHFDAATQAYAEPVSLRAQPLAAWSRLRLHMTLAASGPGTVDLDVDGERATTGLSVPSPPGGTSAFGMSVGGVFVRAPHTGWTARFDDIVLDAR